MKNAVKVLFVISVSVMVYFLSNKNTDKDESVLFNIEALANTEYGQPICVGFGSLDCPVSSIKVLYIR